MSYENWVRAAEGNVRMREHAQDGWAALTEVLRWRLDRTAFTVPEGLPASTPFGAALLTAITLAGRDERELLASAFPYHVGFHRACVNPGWQARLVEAWRDHQADVESADELVWDVVVRHRGEPFTVDYRVPERSAERARALVRGRYARVAGFDRAGAAVLTTMDPRPRAEAEV